MAAAVEPPEPPGQPSGIVPRGVEEQERARSYVSDLREGGAQRVVVQMMRNCSAHSEGERLPDERKVRRVALYREIEGPSTPSIRKRNEVDVRADRADTEAEATPPAGAPDVEDASRR